MIVIEEALVRDLVAAHLPDVAGRPIVALPGGWDNRGFRLDNDLVVRLPRGDPAADLSIAWRWFAPAARRAFLEALPMDAGAWARGAGWAAWKAAVTLAGLPGTDRRERDRAAATLDALAADPPQ